MSEKYRQHQRMGILSVLLLLGLSAICVAVASEQREQVGVGINLQLPWSDRCVSDSATPFWRFENNDDGFRLINPDPEHPAIVRYPVSLWIWPKKLSIMEVTYRAEGLDVDHPDKPVIEFSRENSDDVTVLFMRDLKVDGKKHTLRIDLTERMAEMTIRKQRLGTMHLLVHTGNAREGWFELSELRFEPRDGVKLPSEKKQDFLTHVRVVDLAGEPIPDATVTLDSHLLNCTVEMQTDQEGRVALTPVVQGGILLQRLIQVEKEGYATEFFGNDYALGKNRKLEVVVILSPGQTIGGIVVDEEGNPLAHVAGEVWMNDDPNRDAKGYAWVREHERVVTDAEGRWTCPSMLKGAQVRWRHKGYCEDRWGGHYSGTLKWSELQAHTARSVLKRGIHLSGRVTDQEGKPIENARVTQGDDQICSNNPPVTHTDSDGRYFFENIPAGELIITVTAEGYAPQLVKTEAVGPEMSPIDFTLKPGEPFRFRVVDAEGNPIEGVHIFPDTWKECRTLGKRFYTDENGEAVWLGPPDPVEFHIFVEGKLDQRDKSYAPSKGKDDVHVVVLKPESKVVILATDAVTGEPIPAFKVEVGSRLEGEAISYPLWDSNSQFLPVGKKGRWEHAFSDNYQPYRAFRVQAEGYNPVVTENVSVEDEQVEIEVALAPGGNMEGTLLSPDGEPVSGAMVMLLEPDKKIYVHAGEVPEYHRMATAMSGSGGRFTFPPLGEPFRLYVSCAEGYWVGEQAVFDAGGGVINLLPWAMLSGTLLVGDQPQPGETVCIWSEHSADNDKLGYFLYAECDARGHFVNHQVPAGSYRIGRRVKSGTGYSASGTVVYEIKGGQELEVALGGMGCPVMGSCSWNNKDPEDFATITLSKIEMENGKRNRPGLASYSSTPDTEGRFRIENVEPGLYEVSVRIQKPMTVRRNFQDTFVGRGSFEITVPDLPEGVNYLDTPVDVGVLDINVGEEGRQVVGQCTWDGDEKHRAILSLSQTGLKNGEAKRIYKKYFSEEGAFSLNHVEPGQYVMHVTVSTLPDPLGNASPYSGPQIGELKVEIEVPELTAGEKLDTPVDLGALKIKVKSVDEQKSEGEEA
jgi:protocatechuate 3,4-dioxygenase beta subunit